MRPTLQDVIASTLPPQWVAQLYITVAGAYLEAVETIAGYTLLEDPERRNLLPHFRRNLVEASVRRLSLDCGLQAAIETTDTDSYEFTVIRAPRARFTISKTSTGGALPEVCGFRKQHSRVNDMLMQGQLFSTTLAAVPANDDELIYAIVTHGPEHGSGKVGFVNIGFPRSDMEAWAEPPVSILEIQERQSRLFRKPQDLQATEEEGQRRPTLKPGVAKKKDQGNKGA